MPWLLPVLVSGVLLLFESGLCPVSAEKLEYKYEYQYTRVSRATEVDDEFKAKLLLNDFEFGYYNSYVTEFKPKGNVKLDSSYCEEQTEMMKCDLKKIKESLEEFMRLTNEKEGKHTVYGVRGCELQDDGTVIGTYRISVNEKDFLVFNLKTLTWSTQTSGAENIKQKWNNDVKYNKQLKEYLEDLCIQRLKKAIKLLPPNFDGGSHSLRYFYTGVSGAPPELVPEFVIVGYVDDAPIDYYDSVIRRDEPRAQWMKEREGPEYWDSETQKSIGAQQWFKAGVQILMDRTNQTGGVHTLQLMYGCELHDDGTTRGFSQFGFDGGNFVSFDKETLTWTAATQPAVITKNRWDPDRADSQSWKAYLEEICIDWLKKYVQYGKATLEKKVAPKVKVYGRKSSDGKMTTLSCLATGFYPRDIDVNMFRNGDVKLEQVESSSTLPNEDGTYQVRKWIDIDPNDGNSYSCRVEHSSTEKTLPWDPSNDIDSGQGLGIIIGVVAAVGVLIAVIVGVTIWKKKQAGTKSPKYGKTPTKDQGSLSSNDSGTHSANDQGSLSSDDSSTPLRA